MRSPRANRNGIVEHVLAYPYAAARGSYVLVDGEARADHDVPLEGRHAVVAYGSNASPAVLARKLGAAVVPVVACELSGVEVVYSAHVAPYGAIPATLRVRAGARAAAWTIHVTARQLDRLAATEPNYELAELPAGRAFLSRHGPLRLDGEHVPLAAATQREVQEAVRALLAPDETLEEFIVANAADPERARRMTEAMKRLSAD